MDFINFRSAPGVLIRGAHARPEGAVRASVVLLHGRTEYIEKYEEVVFELLDRGFEVWTFDWRGQGLSSRLLDNPHKGHTESFEDYIGDLAAFMDQVVQPVGPLLMLGHSMGGNVGLRYLREYPGLFEAAMFTAPMLGVNAPVPAKALEFLVSSAIGVGMGERYVASGDYGVRDRRFFGNKITRDPVRFRRAVGQIRREPRLALGGMTFGWLSAALESMRVLSLPEYASGMETPVLMVCAASDQRVDNRACHQFASVAPEVTLVTIPDAEHEILHDRDHIRRRFWKAFDAFIHGRVGV